MSAPDTFDIDVTAETRLRCHCGETLDLQLDPGPLAGLEDAIHEEARDNGWADAFTCGSCDQARRQAEEWAERGDRLRDEMRDRLYERESDQQSAREKGQANEA